MFGASFIIFITLFVNLIGSEDRPQLEITINPQVKYKGVQQNVLLRRVEDTLNLTCRVVPSNNDILSKYTILWHVPTMAQNREHRVIRIPGNNTLGLVVMNLLETDSGDYTCEAKGIHEIRGSVRINVKNKKLCGGEHMFLCPNGHCIMRRYMCDGRPDCKNGVDEAEHYCGQDACENKIMCADGRCIPKSWCCDQYSDSNCTIKDRLPCCPYYPKSYPGLDADSILHPDQQRYSDMGFLQTTIYAVVGSAMAFMFVVTVLIIAICRIHLKRHSAMTARCTNNRVNRTHHHIQQLPIYDIDMCLNRPFIPSEEINTTPGFLVTYNINNGVQFVSRPVNPPPYCEVVSTPPREGPPPPYISHENLPRAAAAAEEDVGEDEVTEDVHEEEEDENVEVTRPLRSEENVNLNSSTSEC